MSDSRIIAQQLCLSSENLDFVSVFGLIAHRHACRWKRKTIALAGHRLSHPKAYMGLAPIENSVVDLSQLIVSICLPTSHIRDNLIGNLCW